MVIIKKKILFFILILSSFSFSYAQQIGVRATIDSTSILIGQQTKIKFEITQPKDLFIEFPQFNNEN